MRSINILFSRNFGGTKYRKKANRDIRKWLCIPISGNVNHLRLKVKQLGIGLKLSSDIYSLKQITV